MNEFMKKLNEMVKLYSEKGYEIDSHHVHVFKDGEDRRIQKVILLSKNFKDNGNKFQVLYRDYSDYETAYIIFMNESDDRYLCEKVTLDHKGNTNHTLGAFNLPQKTLMKSLEIQAELTIIANELVSYIQDKKKKANKITELSELV